ncbi:PAN domain containing protein [Colletotrichum higginsianum]|nr:PAN domain containing protein [Colletotrichum higginsianum]
MSSSRNGIVYELHCETGHSLGAWRSEPASSLKECADICARDPDCFSSDFHRNSFSCALKKAPAQLAAWASGDAWWPTQCPKARAAVANKDPKVMTDLTCPGNDGKIFEGSDGTWFYLQCCTDTDAAVILDYKTTTSQKECSEECVKDKKCKSFMYIPTLAPSTAAQANCRLYANGNFSNSKAEGAHFAFVTDPPTKEPIISDAKLCSTECPEADGQLFVTPTGQNYQISCKKRHGTSYLKIDRRGSFEACMTACAAMPACHSAEFEPRTKKCFYSNNHNAPAIDAEAFVSAHSLGCSGACSGCKKGCDRLGADPMPADAAACDADHGKVLAAAGEDFRLQCAHCFYSNGVWTAAGAKNLAECATACAGDEQCHAANWLVAAGKCTHHGPARNGGQKPSFGQSEECHAIVPLDRSCADTSTLQQQ